MASQSPHSVVTVKVAQSQFICSGANRQMTSRRQTDRMMYWGTKSNVYEQLAKVKSFYHSTSTMINELPNKSLMIAFAANTNLPLILTIIFYYRRQTYVILAWVAQHLLAIICVQLHLFVHFIYNLFVSCKRNKRVGNYADWLALNGLCRVCERKRWRESTDCWCNLSEERMRETYISAKVNRNKRRTVFYA